LQYDFTSLCAHPPNSGRWQAQSHPLMAWRVGPDNQLRRTKNSIGQMQPSLRHEDESLVRAGAEIMARSRSLGRAPRRGICAASTHAERSAAKAASAAAMRSFRAVSAAMTATDSATSRAATQYNPRLKRAYEVKNGVPITLAGRGMPVADPGLTRC
jgi:hypothetical protein